MSACKLVFNTVSTCLYRRSLNLSTNLPGVCNGRTFHSSVPLNKGTILTAVCLQRRPVVTSEKNEIEKDFDHFMKTYEFENSKLSEHEARHIIESAKLKNEEVDEKAADTGETVTALDLEDKWGEEFKTFTPASRTTEADTSNNLQSTDRHLDDSLYLLVKQNLQGNDHWVFPQAELLEGCTLKESAEKTLKSVCGDVQATWLGSAPQAVAKIRPSKSHNSEDYIKLFFYKSWYKQGDISPNKDIVADYMWVTKDELSNYCKPSYAKHLKKFIA